MLPATGRLNYTLPHQPVTLSLRAERGESSGQSVMTGNGRDGFTQQAYINWIDSIRTKDAVHAPADEAAYGNDAVEIVKDWVSIAEDGYLTLRFRTRWETVKPYMYSIW